MRRGQPTCQIPTWRPSPRSGRRSTTGALWQRSGCLQCVVTAHRLEPGRRGAEVGWNGIRHEYRCDGPPLRLFPTRWATASVRERAPAGGHATSVVTYQCGQVTSVGDIPVRPGDSLGGDIPVRPGDNLCKPVRCGSAPADCSGCGSAPAGAGRRGRGVAGALAGCADWLGRGAGALVCVAIVWA